MKRSNLRPQLLLSWLLLSGVWVPASAMSEEFCDRKDHDYGNRCEGIVEIEVGCPDLDLLGFMAYREGFDRDVELKVRFFLPTDTPVEIQARELHLRRQYWMEAKPRRYSAGRWNEFGPWSTGAVLLQEGISLENIGVIVRPEPKTCEQDLLPALIYHDELPTTVDRYTLFLRPSKTLKSVSWTLFTLTGDEEIAVADDALGLQPAYRPFPIRITADGLPEGALRIVIDAKVKNRDLLIHREYRFLHVVPFAGGGEVP